MRASAKTQSKTKQFMIQIEAGKHRPTLEEISRKLAPAGVIIDPNYGLINVNPKAGHFVVRGHATDAGREQAEKLPGVRFFADERISAI
jgi:hypothetical protein